MPQGAPQAESPPRNTKKAGAFPPRPLQSLLGYQAKWENALFASAILWTFSRVVIAPPSPL